MKSELNFCSVSCVEHVLIITINRPEVRNALHPPASIELNQIFDNFFADPMLRVAVLTGAGTAFCAGNDLKHQAGTKAQALPAGGFGGITARWQRTKPVIAAVNGLAFGGGFEIALSCDLIVAAGSAAFALPEARVGVVATAGGLLRLPRQLPMKVAMALIVAGQRLSAQRAYEFGLVNEVVPQEEVLNTSLEWAKEIAQASPAAVRAAMQIVDQGLSEPAIEQLYVRQKSLSAVKELYASPDFAEGPRAFSEKRRPVWRT